MFAYQRYLHHPSDDEIRDDIKKHKLPDKIKDVHGKEFELYYTVYIHPITEIEIYYCGYYPIDGTIDLSIVCYKSTICSSPAVYDLKKWVTKFEESNALLKCGMLNYMVM